MTQYATLGTNALRAAPVGEPPLAGPALADLAIFERLLGLRNDVGLLSEEYDTRSGRLLGNLPQAFSHTAIVNTALTLHDHGGPAQRRSSRS